MIKNAIYNCEQCGKPILRGVVSYRANRHCSFVCKSAATRKIDPDALRAAALAGKSIVEMSRQFQAQRITVRKWLEQDGIFMLWWRCRYYREAA
jgi:hypothetical protein